MGLLDFLKPNENKIKQDLAKEYDQRFEKVLGEIQKKEDTGFIESQWQVLDVEKLFGGKNTKQFLKQYIEWVYANVNVVSESVSGIELKLMKYYKGDVKEVDEHPILDLLYKVNPSMTKSDFFFTLQSNLLLTGEAFIRLKRRNGRNLKETPYELWPMDPSRVGVKIATDKDGFEMIAGYTYKGKTKDKDIELNPWEVIFIKNVNPEDPWRGIGAVEAAARSIDIINFSESYNLNFFKNSAVPYTVLYTDQRLNDNTIERLRTSWNSKYKGNNKAFETAILEQGLKIEKIQQTAKDMDYLEQQKFLRDKLMSIFRTTKVVMGITDDVNRANAEASEYVYSKYCIEPKMRKIIEYLNEFLVPLFDQKGEYFLDFESPIKNDSFAHAQELKVLVDGRMISTNEAREKLGKEPVEGGDDILIPFGLSVLGQQEQPEQLTEEVDQPEKPVEETEKEPTEKRYKVLKTNQTKKYREQIINLKMRQSKISKAANDLAINIHKLAKEMTKEVKEYPGIKSKQHLSKDNIDKFSQKTIDNSQPYEKRVENEIKGIYKGQKDDILRNLKKRLKFILTGSIAKIQKQLEDDVMFNKERSVEVIVAVMIPILSDVMKKQGREAELLLGLPNFRYSLQAEARKWLNQKPIQMAKTMTDTVYERVRNELAEGIKKGEGYDKLIKRVEDIYTNKLERYKAEVVARSEVARASNFAILDCYDQSGVVKSKRWVTAGDERVCDWCGPMDGQIMGLKDTYFDKGEIYVSPISGKTLNLDYEDIQGGSLHANCRCTIVADDTVVKKIEPKKKEEKSKVDLLIDKVEAKINELDKN